MHIIPGKHQYWIFALILFSGCATYRPKYEDFGTAKDISSTKEIEHTFYLIGDAGLSPMGGLNPALEAFRERLGDANENSTAIFLGDNIYPAGLPDPKDSTKAYLEAKNHLDAQLATVELYPGRVLFIPGNHDWYTEGLIGLKRQENYIEEKLEKDQPFEPENGCPIDEIEISENILVVAIDTYWFLTNWNKRPDINDACDIKNREAFFIKLEEIIKKNRQRTTILAMHHPMMSYGSHGGQYSLKKQIYPKEHGIPLPVLGSLVNVLRRTTGVSTQDMQNKQYRNLINRIITLAQYSNKIIITSGHEHTLQYIVQDNTPQIVSGSGAKKGATRLLNGSKFSTGQMGYATLEVYTDGSSRVRYYGVEDGQPEKFLFTTEVLTPERTGHEKIYERNFPHKVRASIYTQEEVDKSFVHRVIWGERYRRYYGAEVSVPTVLLDTLYGGLEPVRKGGGHQSKSLRLRHKSGKEYVMRALRKSAELYLQAMTFKDRYVVGDYDGTYIESIISDFYTGSHPYAPFTIGVLADAAGLYHTNPKLYYVPKQSALQDFNIDFGDELYMIEEHVSEGHEGTQGFPYSDEIVATDDLIENIRKDEKYSVNGTLFARARLFDMLIGDWDRHTDQWKWAEIVDESGEKIVYNPFPRDRDQAYSNMGDGALMKFATRLIPGLNLFEGFNREIRSVKGFNSSPKTYVLDLIVLRETSLEQWEDQARYLQQNITEETIDVALALFPAEVKDETIRDIKQVLLSRKADLLNTAKEYYRIINKFALVIGTDKDDHITVRMLDNNKTRVTVYRIKKGIKADVFFDKIYDPQITREIWIYGLDDNDIFEIQGRQEIKLRIVGGLNNDEYRVQDGHKVHIYDQKRKRNTLNNAGNARVHLTNDYDTNTFDFSKIKSSTNQLLPTIGANPDDGFRIGLSNTYTYNSFERNPYTQQHTLGGSYYFATRGFDLHYSGEFARFMSNVNLLLEGKFTSPNFSINFFGLGNETTNLDDDLGLDYNRVRIGQLSFASSLVWRGPLGSAFRIGATYAKIEVEDTSNRFLVLEYLPISQTALLQEFLGVDAMYNYQNVDWEAFPSMGMSTALGLGYISNISGNGRGIGYIKPSLSIYYKLIPNGRLVLAGKWKANFILGEEFAFYQGSSIGGDDGLRGFRRERFTGKSSFYQNTDLRYSFRRMNTSLFPVTTGIYGGFDYGRVWLEEETSNRWHTSYGGGFFMIAADRITANLAFFQSVEGARVAFGLGFDF